MSREIALKTDAASAASDRKTAIRFTNVAGAGSRRANAARSSAARKTRRETRHQQKSRRANVSAARVSGIRGLKARHSGANDGLPHRGRRTRNPESARGVKGRSVASGVVEVRRVSRRKENSLRTRKRETSHSETAGVVNLNGGKIAVIKSQIAHNRNNRLKAGLRTGAPGRERAG